jgi:uracil phosphoribosyltransferase
MKNVTVITHPLVQQNLARLRDQATQPEEFRRALGEVAALMVYEATRTFGTRTITVQTPLAKTRGVRLRHEVLLVPVLRAGLGMLDPILRLIPHARVGFIGLKRNESTLEATTYHKSLPDDLSQFEIILMDPMAERKARRVRLVNLLAAPEGIRYVQQHYPEVPIFTAAIDKRLNHKGYITPGLGDAGDRLFGV